MSLKHSFLKNIQKSLLGYEVDVLTFSQAGEDLVVRNYFYDRLSRNAPGFFVDIGAFHPYRDSNTYYLYRGGWRGINIDARPGSMELFNRLRPEDINLETAVSDREGTIEFYTFGENAGLNTTSLEYASRLSNEGNIEAKIEVTCQRLDYILGKYAPSNRTMDFLSIDIEGAEVPALLSNDWEKYRFKLIAAEIYGDGLDEIKNSEVARLLNNFGYEMYARLILAMPNVNTVFFVERK